MEDDKRNIDAARRLARRNARANGTPYQTCLDDVARTLGRDHWKAFMESPTEIPRDAKPGHAVSIDPKPILNRFGGNIPDDAVDFVFRDAWGMKDEDKPEGLKGIPFVPGFNILRAAHLPPEGTAERDDHVTLMADILCPREDSNGRRDYFMDKANTMLAAFIHLELGRARDIGREASMIGLVDEFRAMQMTAWERRDVTDDPLGEVMDGIASAALGREYHPSVAKAMSAAAGMSQKERSGVLGTVDQALLPFRNPSVRTANA
jgi:type IV secretion system protein VirD4